MIANATVLDGRSAFTKSGEGKLTLSTATGYDNALTVSGGELHFGLADGVTFGNSITMGGGARLSSAGNMTLSQASGLTLDLTGLTSSSAPLIQSGGTLSFNEAGTLTLTINGVDQTMENDYKLITADSFGTLTANNFLFDSSALSADYTYALELTGNTLYLRVKALGEALNWNGGTAGTWVADGGEDIWLNKDSEAVTYDSTLAVQLETCLEWPPLRSPSAEKSARRASRSTTRKGSWEPPTLSRETEPLWTVREEPRNWSSAARAS